MIPRFLALSGLMLFLGGCAKPDNPAEIRAAAKKPLTPQSRFGNRVRVDSGSLSASGAEETLKGVRNRKIRDTARIGIESEVVIWEPVHEIRGGFNGNAGPEF